MTPAQAPSIVEVRPADAARLTRIAYAAKRHWGYPDELMQLWSADLTITPTFLDENPTYAVAGPMGLMGFYALSRDENDAELEHMWVDPPHMGAGIGRLLFEHAVCTARSLGAATLRIASDPHAEGFYVRMGAGRVGEVPSTPAGRVLPLLIFDLRERPN
jgi:GNAT superfamily N-acetyltransferase